MTYLVGYAFGFLLLQGVRVDQLVSQRAGRQVGSLGDVEDLRNVRLVNSATAGRPKLAQNSKQRRLAASVGTCNHDVHVWFYFKTHLLDKHVTVWR